MMVKQVPAEISGSIPEMIVRLGDRAVGADRVGSKAANLAPLIAAGFQVPDGIVLPVEIFNQFVRINGYTAGSEPGQVITGMIPAELDGALQRIIELLGDGPYAVRSSANDEDLPDASYAGQYETVLGVQGIDNLREAVRQCWASAFNERVTSYRLRRGDSGVPGIAVIVQRQIDADAAGVAFTVNPVTGSREEVVVSAVRGLGERLVSGEAIPDEWLVRGDQVQVRQTPEQALDNDQVRSVARLARAVEKHFGEPQDIEWALVGERLYLLQARPVTGVEHVESVERAFEVPPGFWRRDSAHYPRPMSPMARSFYLDGISQVVTSAFKEFGVLMEGIEAREFGGWVYLRIIPPGGKEGPAPPWWVLAIIARVHPSIRAIINRAREAERSGLGPALIERWWSTWRGSLRRRIQEFQEIDLTSLSDEELDAQIEQRLAFLQEGNSIHFRVFVPFMKAITGLVFFCRDSLGWETRQTMELVSGLSEMSTEPTRQMARLARMAGERERVQAELRTIDDGTGTRLRDADPEFYAEFQAYQREFGIRALGEDIIEPTMGERPEIALALINGMVRSGSTPEIVSEQLAARRESVAEEARRKLRGRPEQLAKFEELLEIAQRTYPVREDNSFPTYQAPLGLIRLSVLELGRRLTERGCIASADDVMFLELPEARASLRTGGKRAELVLRRKGEQLWSLMNPGPSHYGEDPGPPPDMRGLPDEVRTLMESLMWFIENDLEARPIEGDGIRGVGASPGSYTGPVRVIRDESEFEKLQPGDVLVCPITSPVWSVLFANAGGLVTDSGGILSHSAIIAREYGIPAVVGTINGTNALVDGQIVTVDGTSGIVNIDEADG